MACWMGRTSMLTILTRSARWKRLSRVSVTGPWMTFSIGTSPRSTSCLATASNTDSMEAYGTRSASAMAALAASSV